MFFTMLSAIEDELERLKIADIYEKYRYKALHIAMCITHNQQMAEDAVEDAFVEVIKNKDKFLSLGYDDLLPSIVIIVKHRAINIINKNKRIYDISVDEMENELESREIPVEEQVISDAGYKHLIDKITSLRESYRTVLQMRYINDMPDKEIANALGITYENTKMLLSRARLKLRKAIESEVNANV